MVPVYHNLNWVCHILGYDPDDAEERQEIQDLIDHGILKQDPNLDLVSIEEASVYRWLRKRNELQFYTTQSGMDVLNAKLDELLGLLKRFILATGQVYKLYLIGQSDKHSEVKIIPNKSQSKGGKVESPA